MQRARRTHALDPNTACMHPVTGTGFFQWKISWHYRTIYSLPWKFGIISLHMTHLRRHAVLLVLQIQPISHGKRRPMPLRTALPRRQRHGRSTRRRVEKLHFGHLELDPCSNLPWRRLAREASSSMAKVARQQQRRTGGRPQRRNHHTRPLCQCQQLHQPVCLSHICVFPRHAV